MPRESAAGNARVPVPLADPGSLARLWRAHSLHVDRAS
jgi:hypothetical protein